MPAPSFELPHGKAEGVHGDRRRPAEGSFNLGMVGSHTALAHVAHPASAGPTLDLAGRSGRQTPLGDTVAHFLPDAFGVEKASSIVAHMDFPSRRVDGRVFM